jgi:hypothetical protein
MNEWKFPNKMDNIMKHDRGPDRGFVQERGTEEPKFFSAGFSPTGKLLIFCVLVFAVGFLLGRESVFYQIKHGIGQMFGG